MNDDEARTEQPAQPPEPTPEAQRNLGHVLSQLGHEAENESVKVAVKYFGVKMLDKVFGDHGSDNGGGNPEPPPEQPPSQDE